MDDGFVSQIATAVLDREEHRHDGILSGALVYYRMDPGEYVSILRLFLSFALHDRSKDVLSLDNRTVVLIWERIFTYLELARG